MSLVNAFGELALEDTQLDIADALNSLALTLSILSNQLGPLLPNQFGQLRVSVDNTIAAITTLTTLATLTNMAQVGGQNASYDQYGQMMQGPNSLRNQIQVS